MPSTPCSPMPKVCSPTFHHCLCFLSHSMLYTLATPVACHHPHTCRTRNLPSSSCFACMLHQQFAIAFTLLALVACHHTTMISTIMDKSRLNSKNKNRIGRNNSQHYNWKQEETNTMDRNNSTNNVKGKGRGKRNKGPSCHHNTNWGHDEVTTLINYKHKEQIALKQVIDPHTNMILVI